MKKIIFPITLTFCVLQLIQFINVSWYWIILILIIDLIRIVCRYYIFDTIIKCNESMSWDYVDNKTLTEVTKWYIHDKEKYNIYKSNIKNGMSILGAYLSTKNK